MSGPNDWIVGELVAERRRQGLSQREVARRARISTGGMCEMERGDHSPTLRHLHAWMAALGLTIAIRRNDETGCREGCKPDGMCRWVGCERDPLADLHERKADQ